ncbi:hypothetical protein [Mycobacterium sp. 1081908.1]|uniref:hypothetical protein n=1 Tax=Mycobacterium sp. 1081908.1 TaxID=1834066 RepID=UPI000A98F7B1|nr:hypothetical protein [Mycobacterium sp. 1081908.1]
MAVSRNAARENLSPMPENKGHRAEEDVEPEAHEARSRASEGDDDGSYVGAAGSDDTFDAGETGAEARSQDG